MMLCYNPMPSQGGNPTTIVTHIWGESAQQDAGMLYSLLSRVKKKLHSDETGITILSKRPVGYCIERL